MRFKYLILVLGPILLVVGYWASTSLMQRPVSDGQGAVRVPGDSSERLSITSTPTKQKVPAAPVGDRSVEEEDNLIAYLEPSADPRDAVLLLAIRGNGGRAYLENLRELLQYTSERTLVLYLIARLQIDGVYVATEAELTELKEVAPNNAEVDSLLALHAYTNGNVEQALRHFQNAGNASGSSAYQAKYLGMLGDAFLRRNGYLNAGDFVSILGYGAAYAMPNLTSFDQMCRDNTEHPDWRAACGERGQVLYESGETVLERAIGAKLATEYLPGDTQRYASYREQAGQTLVALGAELENIVTNSDLIIDRQTWETYVQIYETEGEIAALRYLIDALS